MTLKVSLFVFILFTASSVLSAEKNVLRLGVLAFGTANWELSTLKEHNLLAASNVAIEIRPVANPQAGKIALQSGAVDIIIADWIWVSRLRSTGTDLSFYPYSNTSGALIVPADSNIKSVADLHGKTLGIAGGELDKNWLLLQALAQKNKNSDLNQSVEKVYGAPPLLNQQLLHNRVDAIINYWHFAAKLEAKGYKQLLNGKDILLGLGITEQVPTLGYVFNRQWAEKNKKQLNQFLNATQVAKNTLCESESAWQKILPLTRVKDLATQNKLRERYCAGRVKQWGDKEQQAAERIYALLRQLSNNRLTGHSEKLQVNTFWNID